MVHWPQPERIEVPVSGPTIDEGDVEAVAKAMSGGFISAGPDVSSAEEDLTSYLGCRALTVCNGSVALMLALRGMGIGPGDEVLVPALTYAATASSVVNVGARPVFCDSRTSDWNLDIDSLRRMVTPRTKAVIVVHLYGVAADIREICCWANEEGIAVIEDAAEALGGTLARQHLGTFGDAGTWSFFGNKVITCGEGGAVTARDPGLLTKLKLLRGQGMDPDRRYFFVEAGYNFRLSNLSSALLVSQLRKLDAFLGVRNSIFDRYRRKLGDVMVFQTAPSDSVVAPWLMTGLLAKGVKREPVGIASALAAQGIETRPIFFPLNEMPAFQHFDSDRIICGSEVSSRGLSLPTSSSMTIDQVDYVCDNFLKAVK